MRHEDDLVQKYVESLDPQLSPTLQSISEQLQKDNKWGINIGAVEGRILRFLINALDVKNILEIGTQYGYSTQWMLESMPKDGKIITIEKDPAHHMQAKNFINDNRAQMILGDALAILPTLETSELFDLVFIDANKKAYPEYLVWANRLLKPGGLIVGDNTFLFGTVLRDEPPESISPSLWKAMQTFNKNIFSDPSLYSCIIPTHEGMTLAIKK